MLISTILKYVTGIAEIVLVVPMFSLYVHIFPWLRWTYLAFHIATLIFSFKDKSSKHGSILGIIAALLPWFPFFSMALHFIIGLILLADNQRI